ncbi:3-oxoacyl-ACP synthase III family protein [Plantactinospora sp. ZYX-F-223]|uniref:3-oxoacyl-ACP synthase III family protein n=1 Tax=Plantactinospora sp. ZYX-F-223 TaxID=3144103 RepID=UPI0031FDAFC7
MPDELAANWECQCRESPDPSRPDLEAWPDAEPLPGAGIGIIGTGSCLPDNVVSNEEVATRAGVDGAWIRRKTGIGSRRWAQSWEATSDLAVVAGRAALEQAGIPATALSMVVVATSTPDSPQPPTASTVAGRLGTTPAAAAFDLNAVCSGFVFALAVAQRSLLASGGYALVVGADIYSRILDPTDRRTAILFGDGAGAVVLGPVPAGGVLATRLLTFGSTADLIRVPAGGSRLPTSPQTIDGGLHYFAMDGRAVREFVVAQVPPAVNAFLLDSGVAGAEVSHLVPHQANVHMLADLERQLNLPAARMHTTVGEYGNTGAASVPITLDMAARSGAIRSDDVVLLAGFGGGMAAGLALLRWW